MTKNNVKSAFKVEFSAFSNVLSKNSNISNIEEVFNEVKNPEKKYKDLINHIREVSKEERSELKKGLKAFAFGGIFEGRKTLVSPSGLMCLDFDNIKPSLINGAKRDLIKNLFVYSVFLSPSGNGLKALIKIPLVKDAKEYKNRFKAVKGLFENNEVLKNAFDESTSDINRLCFVSYDVNIYVNHSSNIFTGIIKEEPIKQALKPVFLNPVISDEERINHIFTKYKCEFDFIEGERNNYIFNKACTCLEYGFNSSDIENYIKYNFESNDFKASEIETIIKSASNKVTYGIKNFDDNIAFKVSTKKKEEPFKLVEKKQSFYSEIVNSKGKKSFEIEPLEYLKFINNELNIYRVELNNQFVFVELNDNKIKVIDYTEIRTKFLLKFEGHTELYRFLSFYYTIFSEVFLSSLKGIDINFIKDTKEKAFKPFLNGVLVITKDNYSLVDYSSLNGVFWESQIIQRNFEAETPSESFEFVDFINKLGNNEEQRINHIKKALGYLSHAYKDVTKTFLICATDETISDDANGGSGKSLLFKESLKYFNSLVNLDAKKLNTDDKFLFSKVERGHNICSLEDLKRNFNFESLYNKITGDFETEKKGKDSIIIPFEFSPKLVATTNYALNDASGSTTRRRIEVPVFQYFNKDLTPQQVYKKTFFYDWSNKDWNLFYSFFAECIQLYLVEGIKPIEVANTKERNFIAQTDEEFNNFVIEYEDEFFKVFTIKEVCESYYDFTNFKVSGKKMGQWLNAYCKYKGLRQTEVSKRKYKLIHIEEK